MEVGRTMAHAPTGTDLGRLKGGRLFSARSLSESVQDPGFLRAFLSPLAFGDMRFYLDDFEGDTIDLDKWIVDGDSGTTNFAMTATNTVARSTISANTAADDNEFVTIYGHCNFSGDKNAGLAVRWMINDVTDVCFEIGFSDPLTDYTLPAINDIDTPSITNGATDVAVIVRDTDQSLTTVALVGANAGTVAKSNLGTWAPTASEWYTTIIQLDGDDIFTATFNTTTPQSPILQSGTEKSLVAGIDGSVLVEPRFTFGNRTTDGYLPEIDFIALWADR